MPTTVNIPGLGKVNFPDEMPPEQIQAETDKLYQNAQGSQPVATAVQSAVGEPPRSTLANIGAMIGQGVLPTAGSIGGSVVGALSPLPGGALIGESAGGMLGEGANQLLGITEPSMAQIGLAGAAPGVFRGAANVLKSAGAGLLKTFGTRELVSDVAGGLLQKTLAPTTASEILRQRLSQQNIPIALTKTAQTIDDVLGKETKQAQSAIRTQIEETLQPFKDFFAQSGGKVDSSVLVEEAKRLRGLSGQAFDSGNNELAHALSAVRQAALDDLESSGVPLAKQAAKAFRREASIDSLTSIARKPKPLAAFEEAIKNDKLLAGTFNDAEMNQIRGILGKLSTATYSGFSGVVGRTMTGTAVGVGTGSVAAGALGAAAIPEMVAQLLQTRGGRGLLEKTLKAPKPIINVGNFAAVTGAFLRGQMAQDKEIQEAVRTTMKDTSISLQEKLEVAKQQGFVLQ